jgi:hypothetical protein
LHAEGSNEATGGESGTTLYWAPAPRLAKEGTTLYWAPKASLEGPLDWVNPSLSGLANHAVGLASLVRAVFAFESETVREAALQSGGHEGDRIHAVGLSGRPPFLRERPVTFEDA